MDLNTSTTPPTENDFAGDIGPKKKFGKILAVVSLIILFAIGGGIYWKYSNTATTTFTRVATEFPTTPDGRIIYTNEKFGYQIALPNGWRVAENLSAFTVAKLVIDSKYGEEVDKEIEKLGPYFFEKNPGDQKTMEKIVSDYEKRHLQEQMNLQKEWDPIQSELVILTSISEQIERENFANVIAEERSLVQEHPYEFISIRIAEEGNFVDYTKFRIELKEGEIKKIGADTIVKKITLNNGYQAAYDKTDNSQYKNMKDSINISLPITNKNNTTLSNGKAAAGLEIHTYLIRGGFSEEEFLDFANSLKLL